jgi:hypothetical protein
MAIRLLKELELPPSVREVWRLKDPRVWGSPWSQRNPRVGDGNSTNTPERLIYLKWYDLSYPKVTHRLTEAFEQRS